MIRLRKSPAGLALAGAFVAVALVLFALHVLSYRTNPADSGASALWFFLLTLPWANLLPEALINAPWWDRVALAAAWLLVALNSFLVYCIAGGIRPGRR